MFVRPRSSATKPPGRMASADPWPWLGAGDVILAMENHGKAAFFEGNWWKPAGKAAFFESETGG